MNAQNPASRSGGARRSLCLFALSGLAVVLMAASAPQCARQEDAPLAPLSSYLPAEALENCFEFCAEEAVAARRVEQDRFIHAIKNCESGDCRAEEAALHVAIMQEIAEDQRICQSACHNQGGGSGGN